MTRAWQLGWFLMKFQAGDLIMEKTCFKCGVAKGLESFHKHKGMKDGRLNKCAACVVLDVAEWRLKKPDVRKIEWEKVRSKTGQMTQAQYFEKLKANAIGRKASALNYYHKNKDKQSDWHKADRLASPEKYKQRSKEWRAKMLSENKTAYLADRVARQNKRRSAQLQRIPPWADQFQIKGMYELCAIFRRVGIDMTVDHIVPLQGDGVCGLHSHDNLQLMHRSDNSAKHNKHQAI